jgi:hypothetical protein
VRAAQCAPKVGEPCVAEGSRGGEDSCKGDLTILGYQGKTAASRDGEKCERKCESARKSARVRECEEKCESARVRGVRDGKEKCG